MATIGIDVRRLRCATTRKAVLSLHFFSRRVMGIASLSVARCDELVLGSAPRTKLETRALSQWTALRRGLHDELREDLRPLLCTHPECLRPAA